jgi:hypothetical protein
MAENKDDFGKAVDDKSGFVTSHAGLNDKIKAAKLDPGLPHAFFLARQPTLPILQAVDSVLRGRDTTLRLAAYELGEVNRISYIGKTQNPVHVHLRNYWSALGPIAPDSRANSSFMEAVGALAIDLRLRDKLRRGPALQKFFDVTDGQEKGLRNVLGDNSPAEIAATEYFTSIWPEPQCLSIAAAWEDQFHPNI